MTRYIITILLLTCMFLQSQAQKTYWTSSFCDLIFQHSILESDEVSADPKLRFTGWFHLAQHKHFDIAKSFGFYSGFGIRNIGLTYKFNYENVTHKEKRRAYTIGIPLALKFGDLEGRKYLFAGGEVEMAFHYKQKHFVGNDKEVIQTDWFSNNVNLIHPSVFLGYQFEDGLAITAKWYLFDFLNADATSSDFLKEGVFPAFERSQIFYISISVNIKSDDIKSKENQGEPKFVAL